MRHLNLPSRPLARGLGPWGCVGAPIAPIATFDSCGGLLVVDKPITRRLSSRLLPRIVRALHTVDSSTPTVSRERVCLAPQSVCYPEWLNANLCPPCCFVAISMNFAVMPAAQRDRELITHPCVRVLGFVQIGGGEDRPDAGRKSNRDVLRRISHALDRGLVAAQDAQDHFFRSSR